MNKFTVFGLLALLSFLATSPAFADKAPQKVLDLANGELSKLGEDSAIVAAVKSQNSKSATLDSIQEFDEKWKADSGLAPYMKELIDSSCGKRLQAIKSSKSFYSEIFVVDNQGANVCMTDKTSDYWQGDEDKFSKSFDGAAGKVYVSDIEFDESTETYSAQVSVPVRDGEKAIGVIVIGVDVDQI